MTGRLLDDLQKTFSRLALFDLVAAENGALLYWPASAEEIILAPAPPRSLLEMLRVRGVPCSTGRVIVATGAQHREAALDAISELGLDWHVILNKGAVMMLPPLIDKATGLNAALDRMKLSPSHTVAVGDGENDLPLLAACGCGVAVANALSALKDQADFVTRGDHGAGVIELIDRLIADDLASLNL